MVKGDWDGDTCGTKWEARGMNMRSRCDTSALETVCGARYAQETETSR